MRAASFLKNHWQVFALMAAIFALWDTPLIQPLRVLIVFLHELSHALATLITGGEVVEFSVLANESGHVLSRGGNRFITLTAGYLGSLLIGVTLLIAALRTQADRFILALFGALLIATAALYIRDLFALAITILTGTLALITAWALPSKISDMILRIIGLTSILYVPIDIFSDTISRPHLRSDAHMLAGEFGGTTMFWGGLWLTLSLIIIALCLRYGLGENSNIQWKRADPKEPAP